MMYCTIIFFKLKRNVLIVLDCNRSKNPKKIVSNESVQQSGNNQTLPTKEKEPPKNKKQEKSNKNKQKNIIKFVVLNF